jgi:outer membrane protein assembly factor BamB
MVYVSGRDGSPGPWMPKDGKVIWQVTGTPGKTGYVGTAAPTVGDRAVIFPSSAGDLMAVLKIGGGTKVWQESLAGKRLGRAYAMTYDVTGDAVIVGQDALCRHRRGPHRGAVGLLGRKDLVGGRRRDGPRRAVAGGSLFLVNDEASLSASMPRRAR